MITIKLLENEYEVINEWEDLTIQKFAKVQQICDKKSG